MMRFVGNLRIGIKLGATSALGILLVAGMVLVQMLSNATIREADVNSMHQQAIAMNGLDVKAAVSGMQIGARDIRLAESSNEIQKAVSYFVTRQESLLGFTDKMLKFSESAEDQETISNIAALANDYTSHAREIARLRTEAVELANKRGNGSDAAPDPIARIANLEADAKRVARVMVLPIALRMGELSEKVVDLAKRRVEEEAAKSSALMATSEQTSVAIGITIVLTLIGAAVLSFFTIARPVSALAQAMNELANGNFSVVLPGLGRRDEIGEVAGAVEKFKVASNERAREESEAKTRQDRIAAERQKADMITMADNFERAVGSIVNAVSSASTQLEASARSLASTASRAQERARTVATASEEAASNVQSVASAAEELSSSINEISRQVQESARMAAEAVNQAYTTTERVGDLSRAASRIGDVIELINTIAGQTNLLALNATIEAARAGEAGRGFAVVASEVKALAEQTAKATGEIGQQITGIQTATDESVAAIRMISSTIERLSEISSTIAAAIEEQRAATQQISLSVQQASEGTQRVSSNIDDVQRGASETGSASSQVLSAAQSLSSDSTCLRDEVSRFLNSVRAS